MGGKTDDTVFWIGISVPQNQRVLGVLVIKLLVCNFEIIRP